MANFHYRLLIIDDEPLGRELLQSSLSEHGFEVGTAKDGFAALAQLHGALPDLIVSDLKMPNMSGFEFLSIARRRFPQIPTIAVSGEFHPPAEPLGVLADAFLAKPFRFEELLARLRTCCMTLRRAQQSRKTKRRSGCHAMESIT
jgi:DNA-binding response OmpR family regulator